MKNKDKIKVELIKELKILQEEREKEVFKNITKRKQTEQAIQESESRFRELFNHMSSGVAVYEPKDNGKDFIIKDFNQAAEKIEKVKRIAKKLGAKCLIITKEEIGEGKLPLWLFLLTEPNQWIKYANIREI